MLHLKIAIRYIFSKKSSAIINLVAIVSIIALSLTIASTLFILSLQRGLEQFVCSMYASFDPPLRIEKTDGTLFSRDSVELSLLEDKSQISSYSFRKELNVVLECNGHKVNSTLIGVDSSYVNVTAIDSLISNGRNPIPENSFGMLLGTGLAYELGISSGVMKPVKVVSVRKNKFFLTSLPIYKSVELLPTGVYTLDNATDSRYAFAPLNQVDFLTSDSCHISSIEFKPADSFSKTKFVEKLGDGFIVKDYMDIHDSLTKMMNNEKWILFSLLMLVAVIAMLSMSGAVAVMKKEKQQNNIVLQSMGYNLDDIHRIFFMLGIFLITISTGIGVILGLIFVWAQDTFGFLTFGGNTFLIDKYPVAVSAQIWLLTILFVILIGVIVSRLSVLSKYE